LKTQSDNKTQKFKNQNYQNPNFFFQLNQFRRPSFLLPFSFSSGPRRTAAAPSSLSRWTPGPARVIALSLSLSLSLSL
jgi:hypothetical protein